MFQQRNTGTCGRRVRTCQHIGYTCRGEYWLGGRVIGVMGPHMMSRGFSPWRTRPMPESSFRPDVEGLRAVAILLVVAFHVGIPASQGGFIGVDVFFVISGYLITGLLVREIESTGRL